MHVVDVLLIFVVIVVVLSERSSRRIDDRSIVSKLWKKVRMEIEDGLFKRVRVDGDLSKRMPMSFENDDDNEIIIKWMK